MQRVRVALFPDRVTAEALRDRLIEAGITAEIHDHLQLQWLWFVSKRTAGARLEVGLGQELNAAKLLREWDSATGLLRGAIRCPDCKSLRVDYPQYTPKSFLTNLAVGLLAELRLIEREYYCEECHCMWSKLRSAARRPKLHQAPNYFLEDLQNEGGEKTRTESRA